MINNIVPSDVEGIAHYLIEESIILKQDNGLYAISNLGAILFAKKLSEFDKVSRKALRIIQYAGNNRLNMLKEITEVKGYASNFENMIKNIDALIPTQELIVEALREKKRISYACNSRSDRKCINSSRFIYFRYWNIGGNF